MIYRLFFLGCYLICLSLIGFSNTTRSLLLEMDHVTDSSFSQSISLAKRDTIYLNSWCFYSPTDKKQRLASVPGTIQSDLIKMGLLPDPIYGENEIKLRKVANQQWIYSTSFKLDHLFKIEEPLLVLEGLDTHAEIFLDGVKIGESHNMFTKNELPLPKSSCQGDHLLEIKFSPSEIYDSISFVQDKIGKIPDTRSFSRKAGYHYGWDWGPKIVTMGIWKPVYIIDNSTPRITHLKIETIAIDQNRGAELKCGVKLAGRMRKDLDLLLSIPELGVDTSIHISYLGESKWYTFPLKAANVDYWWPNGMGHQQLYSAIAVLKENRQPISRKTRSFGVRTLKLNQLSDSLGRSFGFSCNGVPFFAKGANYIPSESFLPLMNLGKLNSMLTMCHESGFNMLRVWGGGTYECDRFYHLCDSLGIVVWQDFMFACYFYPATEAFLGSVEKEATEQIERLSQFTSLALWCGNNEVDEAWKNWGYQKALNYTVNDSILQEGRHKALFDELLPRLVKKYDSLTSYIASSPLHGWGRKESLIEGDQHYWGVWWGEQPFEVYRDKTGRFASEYGFQAYPDKRTIYDWSKGLWPLSDQDSLLAAHQKHPRGREIIRNAINQYYSAPDSFDQQVYLSQIVQKDALTIAIESHRLSMPKCSGTLFWQLNDCWPVTSWSVLDYYLRPKAAWFSLKRLFAPIMVGEGGSAGNPVAMLVSDYPLDSCFLSLTGYSKGTRVTVFDRLKNIEAGKPITLSSVIAMKEYGFPGLAKPDLIIIKIDSAFLHKEKESSMPLFQSSNDFLIEEMKPSSGQHSFKLVPTEMAKEKLICSIPASEKGRHNARIDGELSINGRICQIVFQSDTPIPDLMISLNDHSINYTCSDNLFLLDGKKCFQVVFNESIDLDKIKKGLEVRSWYINNGKPIPVVWK